MFSNLKVYKCGNFFKIISINLKTSNNILAKEYKINYDKKLNNNLARAKTTIQNYALSNDFKYFFTLTFNTSYDRFNLDVLKSNFRYILSKKIKCGCKYLIVPEQHKNGAWHFHGFFTNEISGYITQNDYGFEHIPELDKLGFHNIQEIRSIEKCSNYVTKYISKNLGSGIKKFKHCYFASTGLQKPLLMKDIIYNNEYFNNKFFDFRNDFCRIKTIKQEDYYKFITLFEKC